jgi:hypothetical protein
MTRLCDTRSSEVATRRGCAASGHRVWPGVGAHDAGPRRRYRGRAPRRAAVNFNPGTWPTPVGRSKLNHMCSPLCTLIRIDHAAAARNSNHRAVAQLARRLEHYRPRLSSLEVSRRGCCQSTGLVNFFDCGCWRRWISDTAPSVTAAP